MGQQPNIELGITDAPRSKPGPAPARRWKPARPAELNGPAAVPRGGAFGLAGPDSGYALKLVGEREFNLLPGEHHHDAAVAVAALASARAARVGRAPIADDVSVGMIVLGFDGEAPVDAGLPAARPGWIANVGHSAAKLRGIVADVPEDVLQLTPSELRSRVAAGWVFRGAAG
jgi:hypothetical protein